MSTRNERAVEYLKNLDIQTSAIGGFNRLATYEAFKSLSDLYEEILTETTADLQRSLDEKSQLLEEQCRLAAEKDDRIDDLIRQVAQLKSESDSMQANAEEMINQLRAASEEEKRAIREDADEQISKAMDEAEKMCAEARSRAEAQPSPVLETVIPNVSAETKAVNIAESTPVSEAPQTEQIPEPLQQNYKAMLDSEISRAQQEMEELRKQADADLQRYKNEAEEQLMRFKRERDSIVCDLRHVRESIDEMLNAVGVDSDQMYD